MIQFLQFIVSTALWNYIYIFFFNLAHDLAALLEMFVDSEKQTSWSKVNIKTLNRKNISYHQGLNPHPSCIPPDN